MAKYNLTYRCGHTGEIELFGKESSRQYRLQMEEAEYCPECSEKIRLEKIAKENEENDKKSKEMGFPELQGSEKQIVWATTIRIQMLAKVDEQIARMERGIYRKGIENANQEKVEKYLKPLYEEREKIITSTSAKWFIENR